MGIQRVQFASRLIFNNLYAEDANDASKPVKRKAGLIADEQ